MRPAAVDFWYRSELDIDMAEQSEPTAPNFAGTKFRILRHLVSAFALLRKTSADQIVAPNWYTYGKIFLIISALAGRRNVFLLECIDYDFSARGAVVGSLYRVYCKLVLAPAMRKCVVGLQAMTAWERELFIYRYGLKPSVVHYVPWPMNGWIEQSEVLVHDETPTYVISSGRVACDWQTLFAAEEIGRWPLKVVCTKEDFSLVSLLNHHGRAEVFCDISLSDHDDLLKNASIYALTMKEVEKSSGQVRLGSCIELGIPVVASDVKGLRGYVVDGITAKVVPPYKATELAEAITSLWQKAEDRVALSVEARKFTASYNKSDYFQRISSLIRSESILADSINESAS